MIINNKNSNNYNNNKSHKNPVVKNLHKKSSYGGSLL